MTQLMIPCIYLPGSSPHMQVIPAAQLAEHFAAASALEQAHDACETLHHQAQMALAHAQEQAEQIRQQAYQHGVLEAAQTWAEQQQALIDKTLTWHVDQTELAATLAQQLDTRLRALVAVVLEEYVGEQHAADLIVRRVRQRLGHLLREGDLTLQVADACQPRVREQLAALPHVRVVGCASLEPMQAQLQTPLFTLHIDLEHHLDALLSRLSPLAHEPACDDYQTRSSEPETAAPASARPAPPAQRRDADFPCPIGT